MTCAQACPKEAEPRDDASPGPIADGEKIARAAFDPSAGSAAKGKIENSVVRKKDLFAGELSVWRLGDTPPSIDLPDLIEFLMRREEDRTLFAIVWSEAVSIREIRSPLDGSRALCVLDECVTDHEGNKHPAHAHIALCCNVKNSPDFDEKSETFTQIYRDLANLLKNDTARRHLIQRDA